MPFHAPAMPRKSLSIGVTVWLSMAPLASAEDLVELIAKVEHSVVRIDTVDSEGGGTGSGVIVDDRGGILTNFHVINGATEAVVSLRNGKLRKAIGYIAIDSSHDLALIKTDPLDEPSAIKLAAEMPKVGERVAAFGNPRGFSFSTSEGIVSSIRKGTEIIETIGREAYSFLGYAKDATWIQTTAPISPGNSGGPLVTMKGELVGLNTWNQSNGQNLNFAISLLDIRRILEGASYDTDPHHFADMPKPKHHGKSTPSAPGRPGPPADFKLELPTGRVFAYSVFDIALTGVNRISSSDRENQVLIRHANGALYAAASQQGGHLNGITLGQYDNKQPMVLITYLAGKRHGVMKTWSEAGNAMLFAQYVQGKRNGFSCWHDGGVLRLVLQYTNDEIVWVQLMSDDTPLEGFKTREDAEKNDTTKELFTKLDKFEIGFSKNEQLFRKQVRDFDEQRRKTLAAKLAPEKRRMALDREKTRRAAEDAFLRELHQRANGR
jgi:hypothetical protein